jgi:hypothetical protein
VDTSETLAVDASSSIEHTPSLQVFMYLETWATPVYLEITVVNKKKCALLKQRDRPLFTVGDLTKLEGLISFESYIGPVHVQTGMTNRRCDGGEKLNLKGGRYERCSELL